MKIIQVMPDFGLAGAEIMCEQLTYELIKLNHQVVIVSLFNFHSAITERLEKSGIKVIYLDKKLGFDILMSKKLLSIFRKECPDVVHTHRNAAQYAIPAAIWSGIKYRVHTVHNIASKENCFLARKMNQVFFKYFGLIPVALSDIIRESIVYEYKLENKKVPVIFNGINLTKCIRKASYDIKGNFKILHIGRFSEQKNHIGLINAFAVFHEQYNESELWLIGEGEKRAEIELLVGEKGISDCVKFLGLQDSVHEFLGEADIFTLPSNYEGFPMTLIEAMGTGLPIVATAVGGVPNMLTNGENALLVENSPSDIAEAFEKYYLNLKLRKKYGEKAREASNAFSSTTMAKEYLKVYVAD